MIFTYIILFLILYFIIFIITQIVLQIRKVRYFKSEEFLAQKRATEDTVRDFNEIARYVKEIPNNNKFIPTDKKGEYSHLATFENTSKHDYKRDKNVKNYDSDTVYSASLQVVRKASEEPIKYVCKYFNIKPTEENLQQLEQIGENISRLETTISNLKLREEKIERDFNPPKFILKYFKKELLEKLEMKVPEINIEYIQYVFEYVSAGGNSSQKAVITFNGETVEAIAKYISEKIKYGKSAAAQRALMTNKLRQSIKERDHYTCQICSASTKDQDLLLLEIDHIIPVSKGGLSIPDNLQTLCWKCNRSKSDKILD